MKKPVIVVSRCLLGDKVRYDGRSKPHKLLSQLFIKFFEFRPVCPEVEIGLGVPRKPIQLVLRESKIQARQIENPALDFTSALVNHARQVSVQIPELSACILKARSPSCGVNSTVVKNQNEKASGIFAGNIQRLFPQMPVIDEMMLDDCQLRDQFLENVYCYAAFNNKQASIRSLGLRWILRSGKPMAELHGQSTGDFKQIFFHDLNRLLNKPERVHNLYSAITANSDLFAGKKELIVPMIQAYAADKISFLHIQEKVAELFQNSVSPVYELNITSAEHLVRQQGL